MHVLSQRVAIRAFYGTSGLKDHLTIHLEAKQSPERA